MAALLVVLAAGGALAAERGGSTGGASVQRAGSTVVALQSALGIVADGIYGPQTRAAVRRFQRAHGLVVDGIAGPVTLRALGIAGTTRTTASSRSSGATTLQRIAMCESGGNPTAVSSDGRYRGKYQFSRATWRDLGGVGDPAAAPEAEQDRRAAALLAARGTSPWPSCA
jgi:peptidoglycan hydrolase-like protein with peptidoglycan-binding domain